MSAGEQPSAARARVAFRVLLRADLADARES